VNLTGALQDWVWESGYFQNETCLVRLVVRNESCNQGRIPLYSAVVRSTQHIQRAVLFARNHNLRLVIKNTGHDSSGRSSSQDSLQIYTGLLKGIQYHTEFLAKGATVTSGPAVTIGAGVMQWELYARGAREGFTVIGGECPTVGAVGGFLQGGGVSSFHSHARGLAVDSVLEYQLVTASVWESYCPLLFQC
jgi:FAD/FMN-containing dehydrogenase